jgi:ribosomal protein L29
MSQQIVPFLIGAATLAGFVMSAVYAWRKYGPDKRSVEVTTASNVDEIVLKFAGQAKANVSLHAEVAQLRNELAGLRQEAADARAEAARQVREVRTEAARAMVQLREEMQQKIDGLCKELEHEQEQRRLSNGYARTLASVLRAHDMPVPEPPAGLDID